MKQQKQLKMMKRSKKKIHTHSQSKTVIVWRVTLFKSHYLIKTEEKITNHLCRNKLKKIINLSGRLCHFDKCCFLPANAFSTTETILSH